MAKYQGSNVPIPLSHNENPLKDYPYTLPFRMRGRMIMLAALLFGCLLLQPAISNARQDNLPCLTDISSKDSLLVANRDGKIIYKKNETKRLVPASTLKVLTALAALHYLGPRYRFKTEFYVDSEQNLKIKGYGDPLMISEVLLEIAGSLSKRVHNFNSLVLDDSYFASDIRIPGCGQSTNPYDAPVGALSANFNSVSLGRDKRGKTISSEPQTPMLPFVRERVRSLGLKRGRYAFFHGSMDAALYAGELLLCFLKKRGVMSKGDVRLGRVGPDDVLIYTYESEFILETVLKKMLFISNNFMANQVFIALGASIYGPPGNLAKGVKAVTRFAQRRLRIDDMKIVEGSGISRQNRLSAIDMFTILKRFRPYRHILKKKDGMRFKTGSLKGIRTRAGYMEGRTKGPYYFAIFLNQNASRMNGIIRCINLISAKAQSGGRHGSVTLSTYFLKSASSAFFASCSLPPLVRDEPLMTKYSQKFDRSLSTIRSAMTSLHSLYA